MKSVLMASHASVIKLLQQIELCCSLYIMLLSFIVKSPRYNDVSSRFTAILNRLISDCNQLTNTDILQSFESIHYSIIKEVVKVKLLRSLFGKL